MSTLTEAAAACCACLRVHWTETKHPGGEVSGRWLCTQCGTEYVTRVMADRAREEQREAIRLRLRTLGFDRTSAEIVCVPLDATPLGDRLAQEEDARLRAMSRADGLRADLDTAAAVTKQLQAELEAERHLGEVSQAEYSQAVTHAAARIKSLMDDNVRLVAERDEAQGLCREAQGRVDELLSMVPTAEQMVVLKADYERLIASLPAGPRIVR